MASPGSTEAAIGYYRAMLGTTPPDPTLAEVSAAGNGPMPIPTLYLHGRDDGCMGVELADRDTLDALLPPGSDVQIVPASGHFLHLEQPAAVNGRILEFLGR